jgi:hypothetical protein
MSYFIKRTKQPTELDTLRTDVATLALHVKRLDDVVKASAQATTSMHENNPLLLRQLEDDFIMSQTRLHSFQESFTTALAELSHMMIHTNQRLDSLELQQQVLSKRLDLMLSTQETKRPVKHTFQTARAVFESKTTQGDVIDK